jgi:3-phosphoshikimate 1-carboxyvinyltransferase
MTRRPIGELLASLETLGVRAYSKERKGCPPVIVESQGLKGGKANIDSQKSSQFLSGLLMVAPYAETDVHLTVSGPLVSRPYVEMTLNVMSAFGIEVQRKGDHSYSLRAGQRYHARKYVIEGDASNASYFLSAAAITHGRVRIENLRSGSLQGDVRFPDILEKMGCEVNHGDTWTEVRGKALYGIEIDMNEMPDLVPTLAVTAAFARGETVIKNIGHLRRKESDRIRALAHGLAKMGIRVEEGQNWLKVEGGEAHGTEIETFKDHRIAMSFAVAGLAVSDMKIKGEQCVNKSFPEFWKTFGRLYT